MTSSRMSSDDRFIVSKCTSCKRCGSNRVFWCRSYRTGKPYLVDVDSNNMTSRNSFHSCLTAKQTSAVAVMESQAPKIAQDDQIDFSPSVGVESGDSLLNESAYVAARSLSNVADFDMPEAVASALNDSTEQLIRDNRDLLVAHLNALFAASPDSIDINGREVKTIPLTDDVMNTLGAIAEAAPISAEPVSVKPEPVSVKPGTKVYACVNASCSAHGDEFASTTAATKPVICEHCKRMCKLIKVVR